MSNSVQVTQRRNIAFCGHGSSGKTSLIDAILVSTGAVKGHYSVDDGMMERFFEGEVPSVDQLKAAIPVAVLRGHLIPIFCTSSKCKIGLKELPEPYVRLDVTTPEASIGDIYSDMSSGNGRVVGNESIGDGYQVVHCEVPFREVLHYSRTLGSMTAGQGSYTIELDHYEAMPPSIQHQYMHHVKEHEEELV